MSLGYPNSTAEDRENFFTLPAFLDAIADRDVSYEVWKQKPATLRDALTEALPIEGWIKTRREREREAERA